DGSYDNCCLDKFEVRRMDGDCDGNYDDFGPNVKFCCSDVGSVLTVVFRVYDCAGNTNDCMVQVEVNDKLPPILVFCPEDQYITCDEYYEELEAALELGNGSVLDQFGQATFVDNCQLNIDYQYNYSVDNCGNGAITRTWTATDGSGNFPAICMQTIYIEHVSDWVVEFPADIEAYCVDGELPDFGAPQIFFDDCELIGVSYEDTYYNVVPDACYKVIRNWTVINWCIFEEYGYDVWEETAENQFPVDWDGDGDSDNRTFRDGWNTGGNPGTADGYIDWSQVIKVVDNEAPIFEVEDLQVCIVETDCDTNVTLPTPDVTDCSDEVDIFVTSNLPNPTNNQYVFNDVPPGLYTATYEADDNCGNSTYHTFNILVEDCKKPTPVCEDLIAVIMQTSMLTITPEFFDAGSYDNCPGNLKLSFSADVTDTEILFTCDDLGEQTIQLWVTDAAGNQDYCEVTVELQDNAGVCGGNNVLQVAGAISTESDQGVEDVMVDVNGGLATQMTLADGNYEFALASGGDYSITPMLDIDADNGV
ncbi:MAG: hypothetical protein KDC41_15090, partial [Saprospiraceae bacterium]|nr:hypothetical protein [Saprospiraceae bacterium]